MIVPWVIVISGTTDDNRHMIIAVQYWIACSASDTVTYRQIPKSFTLTRGGEW